MSPLAARRRLSQEEEIRAAHAAMTTRLTQGVQEEMMVAMLECVQGAAAACTEVCVQRLERLHRDMLRAFDEADPGAGREPETQAEAVPEAALSPRSEAVKKRTHFYTLNFGVDDEDDNDEDAGSSRGGCAQGDSDLEAMYGSMDGDLAAAPLATVLAKPTRKRGNAKTGMLRASIDKEHWSPSITRKLLAAFRTLSAKHDNLMVAPVMGKGEVFAKGSLKSIRAATPELAEIVLEQFPYAELPECLQVPGVRQPERVDPSDEQTYTFQSLRKKYGATHSREEIWGYWESAMLPIRAGSDNDSGLRPGAEEANPVRHQVDGAKTTPSMVEDELRVRIDKAHWNPAVTRTLLPLLQDVGKRHGGILVAPVMGRGEILMKGRLESVETAKPDVARIIADQFPFADLPEPFKVDGVQPPSRVDPTDGVAYTLPALWKKYGTAFSTEELQAYWEKEMHPG